MGFLHVGIKNVSDEDRQFSCHIGVFVKNRLDSIGAISFFSVVCLFCVARAARTVRWGRGCKHLGK